MRCFLVYEYLVDEDDGTRSFAADRRDALDVANSTVA
jgi:hypothetical protein